MRYVVKTEGNDLYELEEVYFWILLFCASRFIYINMSFKVLPYKICTNFPKNTIRSLLPMTMKGSLTELYKISCISCFYVYLSINYCTLILKIFIFKLWEFKINQSTLRILTFSWFDGYLKLHSLIIDGFKSIDKSNFYTYLKFISYIKCSFSHDWFLYVWINWSRGWMIFEAIWRRKKEKSYFFEEAIVHTNSFAYWNHYLQSVFRHDQF